MPQGSKVLMLYQERAPNNAVYARSANRYLASDPLQPRILQSAAAHYLMQLRFTEGMMELAASWISHSEPYSGAVVPPRNVRNETLRTVLGAIRDTLTELDADPDARRSKDQQIVLLNRGGDR